MNCWFHEYKEIWRQSGTVDVVYLLKYEETERCHFVLEKCIKCGKKRGFAEYLGGRKDELNPNFLIKED